MLACARVRVSVPHTVHEQPVPGEHPDTDDEEREAEREDLGRREAAAAPERDSAARENRSRRRREPRSARKTQPSLDNHSSR